MNEQNECTQSCYNDLNNIRSIHTHYPLYGDPENALSNFPDDLLLYVISLLKNEIPRLPSSSISQWYELFSALKPHGILPLLYWQILHIPQESRPAKELVDELRRNFLESKACAITTDMQLKELVDVFNKENIPMIILKGSALARTLYLDPALRLCSDIDILVLPQDVVRSRTIMESLGYKCLKKRFDISKYYYHHETYDKCSKNSMIVELHWRLIFVPLLDIVDIRNFFYRSVKIESTNFSFETLTTIDTIIYLSLHLFLQHSKEVRLNWIYDISQLCKNLTIADWRILQKRSVECRARLSLEKSLILSQYWTGLKIPSEFSDFSKWPKPTKDEITAFSYAMIGRNNTIGRFKLRWPKSAPFLEKIKILIYLIFPSFIDMRGHYHLKSNRLVLLCYIKRWFRLIKKI
ncbi:hypothetical protein MCP_0888 [Methanocella paludicola SANAE]|uniref:Nucleotidyltransferase family protein n=1 Tax=Methanocella paludicola (strain DSM 17711 / JCM 13418 / NBRC 101707 / SANAE) TaxID=304371 RepID=D1YWY8_METPS|nr:nucleotidyltransferase family protein [Methanocella paludicola]BAI60960.1 hypothetical protein MCP_0888 [Methanocella paludicola SANAE]